MNYKDGDNCMMKFGIEFVPDTSIDKIIGYSKLGEEGGFNFLWITDHYNNRNTYIVLTAIALSTDSISLGPGVTNPYVVNPAWTASAIASLDEVSGGRAMLGLGAGDKVTLASLGIPFTKPLSTIRESVEVMSRLLKGEAVKYEGRVLKFNGARLSHQPKRHIPIYVGAQGPKMLRLAGKIADGVLINASHPKDFQLAIKEISKGAEEGERDIEKIDVVAYTSFSCDEDPKKAKKKVAPVVAFIAAGCPQQVLERHNIPLEDAARIGKALAKGNFGEAFSSVTDLMVDTFSIYGTPEDCIAKISALSKMGVTQLVVGSPIGPKKKKAIDLISREVVHSFL